MANNKLAKAIEEGFPLREEVKRLEGLLKEAKKALQVHDDKLIETFTKTELKEVSTRLGTAKLVFQALPQVDKDTGGWPAFYGYVVGGAVEDALISVPKLSKQVVKAIVEHGNWELLEKRPGKVACRERWKDKIRIPGIKAFDKASIKYGEDKEEE